MRTRVNHKCKRQIWVVSRRALRKIKIISFRNLIHKCRTTTTTISKMERESLKSSYSATQSSSTLTASTASPEREWRLPFRTRFWNLSMKKILLFGPRKRLISWANSSVLSQVKFTNGTGTSECMRTSLLREEWSTTRTTTAKSSKLRRKKKKRAKLWTPSVFSKWENEEFPCVGVLVTQPKRLAKLQVDSLTPNNKY